MNNLQESILDAMKVFVKDSTSKLNFPLTLECEVIRCTDENKGEYEVKYLENNFLAYCQYKGFKYNPNDVVYVLIPRGDFSKTKVILGLERDELIESDLTDIEPNPAEVPSADLDTIKIGDTVYNIAGTQPTEDIVKDVKVNGSSVVDNEKVANITVPTDTVTTTQMNNAINNATRDLVSETEMNSAIGEAISDLATETYVDNAVSPKANISDVNTALSYKADKSELVGLATETYVDNAVAPKANTSDVNTALALKANSADVTSALALKADKTELIDVEANPSDSGTEDLTKLKVGNTVYNIPSGGGGTEVEANPSDPATDDLTTIKIGDTVYDIPGGGGSGGSGQGYTCDVLFDTPTTISTWASPIEICTEATAKEYDMLYIVSSTYTGEPMVETILVDTIGYSSNHEYIATPRTSSNVDDVEGFVFLSFDSGKLKFYTGTGHSSTLVKVYGLKFKSSVDIFSPQIYSEEERVVGVWTDGKPLYQKTTILTGSYTGAMNDIDAGMSNVDFDFIKFDAHGITSSGTLIHLPNVNNNATGDNGGIMFSVSNKTFTFRLGNLTYGKIIITFQYTKTTDTAGSSHWLSGGVMAVNYTEDEQIIGQWMGKTLYQKTWDFSSSPIAINGGNQWQTLSGVSTVGMSEIIKAECVDYHGTSFNLYVALDGDNYTHAVVNSQTNITMYLMRLTLSYTKTTDTAGNPMANILATQKELEEIAYHYRDHCYTTLSDYYSTEERVVGRWTDGKPLYQKTYDLGSAVTINADSWYNTDISSGDIERIIEVSNGQAQTINTWPLGSAIDSGTIRLLNERNNIITLRWFTIQYTKSTDIAGTGPTPGNLVYLPALYSKEEREVGVWTDGKPLYQKTWDLGSNVEISNSALTQTTISASDMETIVDAFGIYSTGVTRYNFMANIGDGYIKLQTDRNNSIASVRYVTLQYTKSIDQPGSGRYLPDGQLAHHYSTSEKVVGTWIDGSTIYERTWDLGSSIPYTTSDAWEDTGITIPNGKAIYSGITLDTNIQTGEPNLLRTTQFYLNNQKVYIKFDVGAALGGCKYRYITLQYAKSV